MSNWFINSEGAVYVIINGSPYQVDPKGTPFAKLPPGDYTEEEAQAALAKLNKAAAEPAGKSDSPR